MFIVIHFESLLCTFRCKYYVELGFNETNLLTMISELILVFAALNCYLALIITITILQLHIRLKVVPYQQIFLKQPRK